MSTSKMYTVAGTSTNAGKTKVRFANDYVSRFKILVKNQHENINIIELPNAMSKADVCKFLSTHEEFQAEDQQSAINEFVVRNIKLDTTPTAPAQPVAEEKTIKVELETA